MAERGKPVQRGFFPNLLIFFALYFDHGDGMGIAKQVWGEHKPITPNERKQRAMKRSITLPVIGLTLAVAMWMGLGSLQAGQKHATGQKAAKAMHFSGDIKAIDVTAGTFTVQAKNNSKTFKLAGDCKLEGFSPQATSIADLKAGEKVQVAYSDDSGTLTARLVRELAAGTHGARNRKGTASHS